MQVVDQNLILLDLEKCCIVYLWLYPGPEQVISKWGFVGHIGEMRNACRMLFRKLERDRPFGES
jgi:hypothetical protein